MILTKPHTGELNIYTPPIIKNVSPTSVWDAPAFDFKCGSSIDSIIPTPLEHKNASKLVFDSYSQTVAISFMVNLLPLVSVF